jgi:hypothetical protein
LDIEWRKRQLAFRRKQISQWLENEIELFKDMVSRLEKDGQPMPSDEVAERYAAIEKEAKRQEKEAQSTFGMLSGDDPTVAPLRRALAVWGLNIDDIGVASVCFWRYFLDLQILTDMRCFPYSSMVPVPKQPIRTKVPFTTCNSNILVDRAAMRCPWWHRNGLLGIPRVALRAG